LNWDINVAALMSESATPFAKLVLMLRSLRPYLPGFPEEAAARGDSSSSVGGGARGRRGSMDHHFVHPTLESSPLQRLDWCLEHLEECVCALRIISSPCMPYWPHTHHYHFECVVTAAASPTPHPSFSFSSFLTQNKARTLTHTPSIRPLAALDHSTC